MKLICNISLVALICMTAGCNTRLKDCQSLKADDPKIIEFANRYVNTWGSADLTKFEQPEVSEYPDHWSVFYKGKSVSFGYFFTVVIDKKTCKGRIGGGS